MSHPGPRDSGLQPERTLLAWQRTVIVFVAVALLYLRDPFEDPAVGGGVDPLYRLAAVLAVVAAVGVLIAHLRRRWRATAHGLHDDATGNPPAPVARPWALVLLSAATAALALVVAAGALLG
ncbi:DUF202 domain-containing protein [Streptomonospora nanhaiensis]|uniref:Uncharacterized membrane protein YidH (DUF202 family) n=1 Tax=Streptomonospora nanhaiensis TaxID=1323731 RepID=A0A853BQN7_9ACTN|nr:DUF202 domain-containing protein [Streptomonospora nanhaiensis]MBV2365081.1 DUF202 domain-containing protein [Streptomonospora nanhaiensis]NYI96712.1 uncharacterized membrane protein YidH (DUF202 family) [Streptomonospora nanhaiensis]